MSVKSKNEKIKRKFLQWLRQAEGLSESTILAYERALSLFEEFSGGKDYATFSQRQAVGFKDWLEGRGKSGKSVSITSIYNQIRYVKTFFTWLAGQPGYKSKVKLDAVSYLTLERNKVRQATAPRPVKSPSLEHILTLVKSIRPETVIDHRDRALIAFLLVSGMRDQAVATLPLGCFDRPNLSVSQDPKSGVATKFSKSIQTKLFEFDPALIGHVVAWAEYLERDLRYCPADPLFPRTRVEQADGGLTFEATGVEPVFWKGTNSIRKILRDRSESAGLEYYHPHTFRHAAVRLALKRCTTGEQIKAVSQNLGHEHIATTMMTYGAVDNERVQELIGQMDFSDDPTGEAPDQKLDDVIRILSGLKGSKKERRKPR